MDPFLSKRALLGRGSVMDAEHNTKLQIEHDYSDLFWLGVFESEANELVTKLTLLRPGLCSEARKTKLIEQAKARYTRRKHCYDVTRKMLSD